MTINSLDVRMAGQGLTQVWNGTNTGRGGAGGLLRVGRCEVRQDGDILKEVPRQAWPGLVEDWCLRGGSQILPWF